jgi:hypothetical protein
MEKNQHKPEQSDNQQKGKEFPQQAPGQQLPSGAETEATGRSATPDYKEQHSESSLPESGDETLGTP